MKVEEMKGVHMLLNPESEVGRCLRTCLNIKTIKGEAVKPSNKRASRNDDGLTNTWSLS